ncbi:MAG: hypothetical protein JKY96_01770, partial [Phycisphaerales bacterium]|nr:hypothetical protein [Phycisphaerales bacterium]
GMMGGEQASQGVDMIANMFETLTEDGQAFTFGMNFDATDGITLDAGMQFKPESRSASYLHNAGVGAGKYLNNVPGGDFFFAAAMDFSGDGIKAFFNEHMEAAKEMDTSGMLGNMNFATLIKDSMGGAQVMGASNPMNMSGLLSTVVSYYETNDADSMIDSIAEMYDSMNNMDTGPLTTTASFDKAGTKLNGSTAHEYNVKFDLDIDQDGGAGFGAMMDPAMIMQGVFGPNKGPSGYIGKAGNGVVQTMNMDQQTYARAVDAANGKNTLGQTLMIRRAADHLQSNTVLELYFGVDHALNSVGPLLMMFGILPEFEQLQSHAPIAMGFTADGGGFTARTWLPMEVIGTAMELIPQEAFGQMGGEYEDDDNEGMDF